MQNSNRYIDEIVGLRVLNIAHFINLTGFVFGTYSEGKTEELLENSYGLQIACPWVLTNDQSGKILAASGDFFSLPRDLAKVAGGIAEGQIHYTKLDENLKDVLRERLYVEEVNVLACGDLRVRFSHEIELRTFTDFSHKQSGWWIYKCGGAYLAPLQKGDFVEQLITKSDVWWLVKRIGSNIFITNNESSQAEKVQFPKCDIQQGSPKIKTPEFWKKLIGGEVIEVGRKKEDVLKDAPVSWIKVLRVGEKKNNNIYTVYFYCPWRIVDRENLEIVIATADIRSILLWDDTALPVLRQEDYYKEKIERIKLAKLIISDAYMCEDGRVVLKFGDCYGFESFVNHTDDAVCWRGYCQNKSMYVEGGRGFQDYHGNIEKIESSIDSVKLQQALNGMLGSELRAVSRKGTYYTFSFSKKQQDSYQLVCGPQWRLLDLKINNVLIGGRDCFFSCMQFVDSDMEVCWRDTINTRYDELYEDIFGDIKLQIEDVKVTQKGDLQIYFSNKTMLEYCIFSAGYQEEWQIRGINGFRVRGYGNVTEIECESELKKESWLDSVEIEMAEDGKRQENKNTNSSPKTLIEEKMQINIGTLWTPDMMEDIKRGWRLCDKKEEKILFGIGDFEIPGEKTEWAEFYEDNRGNSRLDDMWNLIREEELIVEAVNYLPNGDITLSLSDEKYVEIL